MRVQGFHGCTDFFLSWSYFILRAYFLWVSHMKFVLVRDANNRTQINKAKILQPLNSTTAKKTYQLLTFTTLKFTICVFPWKWYNKIEQVAFHFHDYTPTLTSYLPTLISNLLFSCFRPDSTSLFPKSR